MGQVAHYHAMWWCSCELSRGSVNSLWSISQHPLPCVSCWASGQVDRSRLTLSQTNFRFELSITTSKRPTTRHTKCDTGWLSTTSCDEQNVVNPSRAPWADTRVVGISCESYIHNNTLYFHCDGQSHYVPQWYSAKTRIPEFSWIRTYNVRIKTRMWSSILY